MKASFIDQALELMVWALNPRIFWNMVYEIGYDAGCRDGRDKAGDAKEREDVISRWGEKRRELLLPSPDGYRVPPRIRGMGKKSRRGVTRDVAYAIGYYEGYCETVVSIAGEGVKLRRNFENGIREGRVQAALAWEAWNARRMQAAQNGRSFDEPPPTLYTSQ